WGECICVGYATTDGALRWNGGGKRGLYTVDVCRGAERATHLDDDGNRVSSHPTQKPLALMRQLVEDFTDPGDTILDPFAGSGTTLIAASRLGRIAIGSEINPAYYELALRRLRGDETHVNDRQLQLLAGVTAP